MKKSISIYATLLSSVESTGPYSALNGNAHKIFYYHPLTINE